MEFNKEFVLCQSCKEVYDEPCVMSCGDSICLSCIKKLKKSEEQDLKQDPIECPLCKDQVSGYKIQANLKKLLDSYKEEQLKESHKCLTHTHIRLSLYCETCHQPICSECSKSTHSEHKLIDINREQFAKSHSELIQQLVDIEGARNIKSNQIFLLKTEFKSIQESYDSQLVEIDLLFKSIKEFLENRETEVKRQLKSYHDTNQELYEKNREVLEDHSHQLSKAIQDITANDYLKLSVDTLFKDHKYFVVLQNYQSSKLSDIISSSKSSPLEYVRFRKADLRYHGFNTIQERIDRMIRISIQSSLNSAPSQSNLSLQSLPNTTTQSSISLPSTPVIGSTKTSGKRKSSLFKTSNDNDIQKRNSTSLIELQRQPSLTTITSQDSDYSDDEDHITLGSTTSTGSLDDLTMAMDTMSHNSFFEPQVQKITIKNITLVYNPFSGSKIGEKIMNQAKKYFEEHGVNVSIIPTEYKNHAEDICKEIDVTNVDVVCMIGGDGTIHEAVNGIMKRDADSRSKFVLACLPAGTGNSFVLELQGKLNIKYICSRILKGITTPIDIARVTVLTKDKINQECANRNEQIKAVKEKYGSLLNVDKAMLTQSQNAGTIFLEEVKKGVRPDTLMEFGHSQFPLEDDDSNAHPEVIYSFNSLHWGLGSRINIRAEKLRWMGKAVRYTTAALLEMFKGEKILARIEYEEADGNKVAIEDEFCLGIINNIQGAAKGMKMAPKAKLNDGLIDLILIKSQKTIDLMSIFAKIYDGTHTELDYVIYKQVKRFSITPFKQDKERKKLMKKEKKRISKASSDDVIHSSDSTSHLEIFKGSSDCSSNTILGKLKDEIDEEIIDIDGELKGTTPFVCEMIPRSIRVIV